MAASASLQNRDASTSPPPYTRRSTSARRRVRQHSTHLYTSTDKPWATLTINSSSKDASALPNFFEGDALSGSVTLNLERGDHIRSVSITVIGRLIGTTAGAYQSEKTFLEVSQPLWPVCTGESSSNPQAPPVEWHDGRLSGKYSWPFRLELPKEACFKWKKGPPTPTYPLPPTFMEKGVNFVVQYDLEAHIRRTAFRLDSRLSTSFGYSPYSQAPLPSPLRQLAYRENIPIIGPEGDPEGWECLPCVSVLGKVFNNRSVGVDCTLSVVKPLCYARGAVIPCKLTLSSLDTQALDLLSRPTAPVVHLVRRVGFEATLHSLGSRSTKPGHGYNVVTSFVAKAVWWPSQNAGGSASESESERCLDGEIHLSKNLHPSCVFANFEIGYTVQFWSFEATGFAPVAKDMLLAVPVEIATVHHRGPRPRRYAPPGYDMRTSDRTQLTRRGTT